MDSQRSEGEQDGTQRWFAGLPSVGVVPPEALTDHHQDAAARALRRAGRRRLLLLPGTLLVLFLLALSARVSGMLCVALPFLLLLGDYAPKFMSRARRLRTLSHRVDDRGIHGTVERFEGRLPFPEHRQFRALRDLRVRMGVGPRIVQLDVLREVGLVLTIDGFEPAEEHCLPIQTTSDRMAGTEQGATRPLATNERVELTDLARHDSVWRTILPGAPALLPIFWLARAVFGWPGIWGGAALTLLGTAVFAVTDLLAMRRRHAQVMAAQRAGTVMGGVNRDGEQVEVLLPDKLLWTVGGRPAPDRLRERSRALSGTLGDRHAPTTF